MVYYGDKTAKKAFRKPNIEVLSNTTKLQAAATTSTVTSIQQKRAKQLEDAAGVRSKPGPGATGVIPPDDFDAAFEMFAADNR